MVCEAVLKIYCDNTLRMCLINKESILGHEKYSAKRVSQENMDFISSLV